MKKLLLLLVTALFVLSFASMSVAAGKDEQKAGTVKSVDAKAGTITITGADKADTTFKADKATLGKWKAGDKVKITYSGDTAKSIMKDRPGMKVPVGC